MSVQFGKWNFDGLPAVPEYLEKVTATLDPYGPDSNEKYSKHGITMLYRGFRTTKESHHDLQPHVSPSGAVITWDGCLDNRKELMNELRSSLTSDSSDVALVAAGYEQWGRDCFAKFIGDWALSIWNPSNRSLLLAKDPIGTRHLYYCIQKDYVAWSTTLDPLILLAGKRFELSEEYVAGWFSAYPAAHLTPYVGIRAVPPSSSVLLRPGGHSISKFWDFNSEKRIRYRTESEYEEHFRSVFFKAVQRKLRCDTPVLAELSGGRDSSSIVCMADAVISHGQAECPRLDTISYFDDSEPNWNERPYFTKVEEKRGRVGWHVSLQDLERSMEPEAPREPFVPAPNYPGYDGRVSQQLRACLTSQGNRVLLSGIGGDEVMGGVPTPIPELQDLLARAHVRVLAHQLKVWALAKRKPWFYLFWEAVRDFLPPKIVGVPKNMRSASWLQSRFLKRHWAALHGYGSRVKLVGPLPSFQANLSALDVLRRQLARAALPFDPPCEKRYPYLDRDLLEFMFSIPREQLVRPTQRRSLMRRALVGIVPDEILNRRNKAFVARAPLKRIATEWPNLEEITQHMMSSSLGIVNSVRLSEALQKAQRGHDDVPISMLLRTLFVEDWLKTLSAQSFVNLDKDEKPALGRPPGKREKRGLMEYKQS